jgi:hypothetical protein
VVPETGVSGSRTADYTSVTKDGFYVVESKYDGSDFSQLPPGTTLDVANVNYTVISKTTINKNSIMIKNEETTYLTPIMS